MPGFFSDPSTFGQFSGAINGMFQWNSAWPVGITTESAEAMLGGVSLTSQAPQDVEAVLKALAPQVGSTGPDDQWVGALKSLSSDSGAPTYIGSVSPWFFTHYGPDTFNKNVSLPQTTRKID